MHIKLFGLSITITRAGQNEQAKRVLAFALNEYGDRRKIPLIKAVRALNLIADYEGKTSLSAAHEWVKRNFDFDAANAGTIKDLAT